MSRMRKVFSAGFIAIAFVSLAARPAKAQATVNDACKLLSTADIAQATGLSVAKGQEGAPIPGALDDCWWTASDGSKIVVVTADAAHMQVTMQSQLQTGADTFDGVGTSAVGTNGIQETGGGYNLSVLDNKGGVAVSIVGGAGTSDRAIALAKVIETEREK